ncbi:MAG: hypothetical protein LBH29_07450, partial [Elusimicrobiota bacterium]|nr:hypothetical protein [Elusimicrobiota bacterium]
KITEKIPRFKSIKDLMTFIQENLGIIGEINIKETGQTVSVSKRNIKRDLKRGRDDKHNQVYAEFKQLFENAKYKGFREADERHKGKVKGQDIFLSKMELDGEIYNVEFMADAPIAEAEKDKLYYAGHKIITLGSDTGITQLHTESDGNLQKTAENNNQDGDVKYSRADNANNTNAKQDGQMAKR